MSRAVETFGVSCRLVCSAMEADQTRELAVARSAHRLECFASAATHKGLETDLCPRLVIQIRFKEIKKPTSWPAFLFLKIGWGDFITSEPHYPHDFVELTYPGRKRISEKAIELYEKGHSIAETAAMVGMPTTTLFDEFKEHRVSTRPASESRKKNPPYGYAWLSGEIVMNPLEYKNVLLIQGFSKMGKRPHQIANYLNDQGIKPRWGKKWFARTVTDIIQREERVTLVTSKKAYDIISQ